MWHDLLTAAAVVALLLVKDGLMAWRRRRLAKSQAEILLAVQAAVADVGLNVDQASPTTDLVRLGKLHAVIHQAGIHLQRDPQLRTVQDVVNLLAKAPARS